MRKDWASVPEQMSVADFRTWVPLGSTSKAVMIDPQGHYRGIIATASAWRPDLQGSMSVSSLASLADATLAPSAGIRAVLQAFDTDAAAELVVIDDRHRVVGVVSAKYARRRYFEEVEAAQRDLFGEG